jgi:hypothetical protein
MHVVQKSKDGHIHRCGQYGVATDQVWEWLLCCAVSSLNVANISSETSIIHLKAFQLLEVTVEVLRCPLLVGAKEEGSLRWRLCVCACVCMYVHVCAHVCYTVTLSQIAAIFRKTSRARAAPPSHRIWLCLCSSVFRPVANVFLLTLLPRLQNCHPVLP